MYKARLGKTFLALLLSIAALAAPLAAAQQVIEDEKRDRPLIVSTLVGTLQGKAEDEGYLTISGTNYNFDSEVTEIYLDDNLVRAGAMDEGMSLRISLDARGTLVRIDILGPFSQTRLLDEN